MEYTITVVVEARDGTQVTVSVDSCTEENLRFFVDNTPLAWSIPLNKQLGVPNA